jgi:hypothetical protein
MYKHRKLTAERIADPRAPFTKTELLDHLREIRDLLNSVQRDNETSVWQALGAIRFHTEEALEPGYSSLRGVGMAASETPDA